MRWHPAPLQPYTVVGARSPVTYYLSRVFRRDIVKITIDPVNFTILEDISDVFQHPVMGKKIIRVHQANHVARRPFYSLVYSVINAVVRLGAKLRSISCALLYERQGAIGRLTILDHVLYRPIALRLHTSQGIDDGVSPIEHACHNRDFHVI